MGRKALARPNLEGLAISVPSAQAMPKKISNRLTRVCRPLLETVAELYRRRTTCCLRRRTDVGSSKATCRVPDRDDD